MCKKSDLKTFIFLGIFFLILISFFLIEDNISEINAVPVIYCNKPLADFGEMEYGNSFEHSFTIENRGSAILKINKIRTPCCCKMKTAPVLEIKPGKSEILKFVVKPFILNGKSDSPVIIESNDRKNPLYTVTIKGIMRSRIILSDDLIKFGTIPFEKVSTESIILESRIPDLEIIRSRINSEYFKASISKLESGNFKIDIKTVPPLPPKNLNTELKLEFNKIFPELNINILSKIDSYVSIFPGEIIYTELTDEASTRYIQISPGRREDFKIEKIELPLSSMSSKIYNINKGHRIEINNIIFKESLNNRDIVIHIKTDEINQVRIPFKYINPHDKGKDF